MKFINSIIVTACISIGVSSCGGENPITPQQEYLDYFPLPQGYVCNYEFQSSGKPLLSKDSVAGNIELFKKIYKEVVVNVALENDPVEYEKYFRRSRDTVFTLEDSTETIMLIERANASWTIDESFNGLSRQTVFTVLHKDTSHTIDTTVYRDVIHVRNEVTTMFQGQVTTAQNEFFYAKNIGLIEHIVPSGNIILKSYIFK